MNKKLKTIISRGLVVAMLIGGTGTMLVGCNNDNEGTKIEMMNREDADFEAQGMIGAVYGYGLDKTVFESLKNQVIVMVKFSEEDIANVTEEQLDIFTLQNRIEQMYLDNGHDLRVTIHIYDETGKIKLLDAIDPTEIVEPTEEQDVKKEETTTTTEKQTTNNSSNKQTNNNRFDENDMRDAFTQGYYNGYLDEYYHEGGDSTQEDYYEPEPTPEPTPESNPSYESQQEQAPQTEYEETPQTTQDYE